MSNLPMRRFHTIEKRSELYFHACRLPDLSPPLVRDPAPLPRFQSPPTTPPRTDPDTAIDPRIPLPHPPQSAAATTPMSIAAPQSPLRPSSAKSIRKTNHLPTTTNRSPCALPHSHPRQTNSHPPPTTRKFLACRHCAKSSISHPPPRTLPFPTATSPSRKTQTIPLRQSQEPTTRTTPSPTPSPPHSSP